ncbi:MAG: ferredoxin--NADP reductase [Bdellovibrionales bacterium]|nr:ferredoxin--NADP reductase [Bdellovibrionales bacterium]
MNPKTYPLTVKKKIIECDDACTLVLSPRNEDRKLFSYKPAQFLSFHMEINKQQFTRSYSISSSPLAEEDLTTSIKKVHNGHVSSHIVDHIQEGDTIQSTIPRGRFFKMPDNLKPRHYLLLAAGSGITPLFSILKTALLLDEQNHVTLVYCNRKETSIIYKAELEKWKKTYPTRLKIISILSQPDSTEYDFKGRINENILKQILGNIKTSLEMEAYLCGPIDLMTMAETVLRSRLDKKQIRKESFGTTAKKKNIQLPKSAVIISADASEKGDVETIKALLEGEQIEIPAEPEISILEQLIEAGFSPPFSCMEGNCMTCMAVLKKGQVYQDEAGILAPENISDKEILTCQAKPLSPIVEVDYD